MNLTQFLIKYKDPDIERPFRPRIRCKDGFEFSAQASEFHYCEPRENYGPYASIELGFPSHGDSLIQKYAESPKSCRKTVYGWVPFNVVEELIAKHGGITKYRDSEKVLHKAQWWTEEANSKVYEE